MAHFLVELSVVIKILHFAAAFILVVSVLLQAGKGTGLGAAFGGGTSQTLFGAGGGGTFLGRVTMVSAAVFLVTSLSLAIGAKTRLQSGLGGAPSAVDVVPVSPAKPEVAPGALPQTQNEQTPPSQSPPSGEEKAAQ